MYAWLRTLPRSAKERKSSRKILRQRRWFEWLEDRSLLTADLSISNMGTPPTVLVGGTETYTITITNSGDAAALGAVATDSLPAGLTLVSATDASGTVTTNGNTVTDHLGTLAANNGIETLTITATAAPVTPGAYQTTVSDTASLDFNGTATSQSVNTTVQANYMPQSVNQPFTSFPTDFTKLPTVSIVVPNVQNDMHDNPSPAGVTNADTWLQNNLGAYAQWAQSHNSLLIVTWDENDTSAGNHIPTIFVGQMVNAGSYSEAINHYNVLRTIEDMYGLPYAGASATATPITDIWTSPGSVPRPDHVVVVIEENHDYTQIIGQSDAPYINSLASAGALMTNSTAIEHPSQPNYLDLFSGSNQGNQGSTGDARPTNGIPYSTPNLGAELLAAGDTFVGYSESLPVAGFDGTGYPNSTGGPPNDEYARRHNPWSDFIFTQYEQFVTAVYHDVLNRLPDAAGLQFWSQSIETQLVANNPPPLANVVSQVAFTFAHSPEYYANFVIKPAFLSLLGRAAADSDLAFYTQKMQNGLTDQQLEATFVASDEFYANAGGTDKDWIDQAYLKLLGRAATGDDETFWTGQLASGMSRGQVALLIANSAENDTLLITADYNHYLNRAPDSHGLMFYLQQFDDGVTNENVIAEFTGSLEYFNGHSSATSIV
jgi:uncharacterized repeat protein (TIGR01451 family)